MAEDKPTKYVTNLPGLPGVEAGDEVPLYVDTPGGEHRVLVGRATVKDPASGVVDIEMNQGSAETLKDMLGVGDGKATSMGCAGSPSASGGGDAPGEGPEGGDVRGDHGGGSP